MIPVDRGITMAKAGDVVLAYVQFTDTFEVKKRPAIILFKEYGNVVVAGVTSNLSMEGIPLTKSDGAIKESVIKPNYIFTISGEMVEKTLFSLPEKKKRQLFDALLARLGPLKES